MSSGRDRKLRAKQSARGRRHDKSQRGSRRAAQLVGSANLPGVDRRRHRSYADSQRLAVWEKIRARYRAADLSILRMNPSQRTQHVILAVSFIVLAITGFALKFPDSWIAKVLGSNEMFRRWSHRVAGVVLLLVGAYHIVYVLATKEGWKLVRDFLPARKDAKDV